MRRKTALIGIIFLLSISIFAGTASCDTVVRKLGRGFCNVITAPLEIFEQIKNTNNSDGPMAALTYGLLKGIAMTGVRAAVGAYEIATFPIPMPRDYKPILKDPEFFFEETSW